MRHRIEKILARVVHDAVERAFPLDALHLVDLPEGEVVTAAGLIAAGKGEPRTRADALDQRRWLPGDRRHLDSTVAGCAECGHRCPAEDAPLRMPLELSKSLT